MSTVTRMTQGQITTALDMHGHEWKSDGAFILVYEVSTTKGHDGVIRDSSRWIVCPDTKSELLAWLGY